MISRIFHASRAWATAAALAVLACAPALAASAAVHARAIVPADGSVRVNVHQKIKIAFSGALDPASVTRQHVMLLRSDGQPVGSTLSYDDQAHRITVQPSDLYQGQTYSLDTSGLLDASGQAVAPTHSSFSTWINAHLTGQDIFRDESGNVYTITSDSFDAQGRLLRTATFFSPGVDGQWGTADDVAGLCDNYTPTADGRELASSEYDAGPDGRCATPDDVRMSSTVDTFNASGALLTRTTHFDDPAWAAESDSLYRETYGPDGLAAISSFISPGPDGILGTADDVLVSSTQLIYDSFGRMTRYLTSSGPGADGLPFTDDDVVSYGVEHFRANGRWTGRDIYSGAGADKRLFTADDPLRNYARNTYDARGNLILQVEVFGPGPDGIPHTADDVPLSYTRTTFDNNDNRVHSEDYSGPGPDGLWFTADDLVSRTATYDTSR